MHDIVYTMYTNGLVFPKPARAGYITIGDKTIYVNANGYKDDPPKSQDEIDLEDAMRELDKEFPTFIPDEDKPF